MVLIIFIGVTIGCDREEWLDIQPQGVIIPSNVEDYRLLLDQVNDDGISGPNPISNGFEKAYYGTDYLSDDFTIKDETYFLYGGVEINEYTWQDNRYAPNEEDGDWSNLYGQIYVTNLVIEEVMDAKNGTESEKLALMAEAKVHRAYAYFTLANLYGLHYNLQTATTNTAVPLRLGTEIVGVDFSRASVAEVYDLVIEDITGALNNLPDMPVSSFYNHRPSKASAYALLSRVYLYQGVYDKALETASKSLALHNVINDFNRFGEVLGVLKLDETEEDKQLLWNKAAISPYGLLIASDDLFNLYEDNDIRRKLFGSLEDIFGIAVPGNVLAYPFFINSRAMGFTVPEVILTKAECNARLGNTAEAVSGLNKLREKRFKDGTYTPITSTDQAEVLKLVKKERRMEFPGSGLRYFDLKRYNELDNANITLTRVLNGQTYTLNANGKNWAIPIAQKYILETPELGENIRD